MTGFVNPHERIARLEEALEKCIQTFDDMQRVLRLLGRPIMADACAVAADSSRDVLTPAIKEV
jgi:hypothetical protein